MSDSDSFSNFRSYFLSQKDLPKVSSPAHAPFVTISRQAGAGAETVARLLAEKLNTGKTGEVMPWTVVDQNLLSKVLEDQSLPQELAKHIHEDKDTTVEALVGELLGLHPSMWTLFHHTSDTILKLARIGRSIIVGRGGNIITAKLKGGIHVRLVGPESVRLTHLKSHFHLDDKAAAQYLHEHDQGRRRYVKTNFDRNIEDPLLYDAVLNTGRLGFQAVADTIAALLKARS